VRLQITGVTGLTIYTRINRFLASQSSVENAVLLEANADVAVFELQVRGGLQSLQQGLQLGGLIEPAEPALESTDENVVAADLYFSVR